MPLPLQLIMKQFKNTEILHVIESIAREKSIGQDDLFEALESVMQTIAKSQYGDVSNVDATIDKRTGNIRIFRKLTVVEDKSEADDDTTISITNATAGSFAPIFVGAIFEEELPAIDFSTISLYLTKNLIETKIKEIEVEREYHLLNTKIGEIVNGVVKAVDKRGVTIAIDGIEAHISKTNMIKSDSYKPGERIKAFLARVDKSPTELKLHLSRTSNEFLKHLLQDEVPEINDGLIEIKGIARDPGSRAKVVVHAADRAIDAIGSCIGIKGARIQAIISELSGEKINVIRWSPEYAQYIINCFLPIQLSKIFIDEDNDKVNIKVQESDLSAAIGRRGQNIRLISKLVGMHINIFVDDAVAYDFVDKQQDDKMQQLMTALDIDELLAQLLMSEGYTSVEVLSSSEASGIAKVEGLDEEIGEELILRAQEYLANSDEEEVKKSVPAPVKKPEKKATTFDKKDVDVNTIREIRQALTHAGITDICSIAEMSGDELQEILQKDNIIISREKIDETITQLRERLFFNVTKK